MSALCFYPNFKNKIELLKAHFQVQPVSNGDGDNSSNSSSSVLSTDCKASVSFQCHLVLTCFMGRGPGNLCSQVPYSLHLSGS